jgi:hypothetical protein
MSISGGTERRLGDWLVEGVCKPEQRGICAVPGGPTEARGCRPDGPQVDSPCQGRRSPDKRHPAKASRRAVRPGLGVHSMSRPVASRRFDPRPHPRLRPGRLELGRTSLDIEALVSEHPSGQYRPAGLWCRSGPRIPMRSADLAHPAGALVLRRGDRAADRDERFPEHSFHRRCGSPGIAFIGDRPGTGRRRARRSRRKPVLMAGWADVVLIDRLVVRQR